MKNSEEFRRTVFEKAKRYEEKRKARRRKCFQTVSLCSLCVVIGISAFFGIRYNISDATSEVVTTDGGANMEAPNSAVETTDGVTEFEQTTDIPTGDVLPTTSWSAETTAVMTTTMPMGTMAEGTYATSTSTHQMETTAVVQGTTAADPHETSYCLPENILEEQEISASTVPSAKPDRILTGKTAEKEEFLVYRDAEDFSAELVSRYQERLLEEDCTVLRETYDAAFFAEHMLIAVYVPIDWTAYDIYYQDGGASRFLSVKICDAQQNVNVLHLYAIPQNEAESLTLLTYRAEK